MVEADLERAEERAELGEKYVFIRIIVDCCVVLIAVDLEISLKNSLKPFSNQCYSNRLKNLLVNLNTNKQTFEIIQLLILFFCFAS